MRCEEERRGGRRRKRIRRRMCKSISWRVWGVLVLGECCLHGKDREVYIIGGIEMDYSILDGVVGRTCICMRQPLLRRYGV